MKRTDDYTDGKVIFSGNNMHDAFISYSREGSIDQSLALALKSGLEKLLRRWYQHRSFDIFLDENNLPPDSDLWTQIEEELKQSKFLILLLSPEATISRGVAREFKLWLSHKGGVKNICLILTSGDVFWSDEKGDFDWQRSTSLPAALSGAYKAEPHWLDLRWIAKHSELTPNLANFRVALLQIAAAIRGVSHDTLENEAMLARRSNMRWAIAAVGSLVSALAAALVLGGQSQNASILGQARLLQATLPAESFAVLSELDKRWWTDDNILQFLPSDVAVARLSVWRQYLSDGASGIAITGEDTAAAALQDGTALVWNLNGNRLALVPARHVSSPSERGGFKEEVVPLTKLGFLDGGKAIATRDWHGCLRIMPLTKEAIIGGWVTESQECVNRLGENYGHSGWDLAGNAAWVSGDRYLVHGGGRTVEGKLSDAKSVTAIMPIGDSKAIALHVDGHAVIEDTQEGPAQRTINEVSDIGTCLDGSFWALMKNAQLLRMPTNKMVKLAGKSPWRLSHTCGLYVDGNGDVYRLKDSKLLTKGIADAWQSDGNMVQIAFSNGDDKVAVSSKDGGILLYELYTNRVWPLRGHTQRIFEMTFSTKDSHLYSVGFDRSIRKFDLRGGLIAASAPSGARSIYGGMESPLFSGEEYVGANLVEEMIDKRMEVKALPSTGTNQERVYLPQDWKIGDNYLLFDDETDMSVLVCSKPLCPPGSVIRSFPADGASRPAYARASPDGRYIAAIDASATVRIFDLQREENRPVFQYHGSSSTSVIDAAFVRNGSRLLILDGSTLVGVPLTLREVGRTASTRISLCFNSEERRTYLQEWSWLARWRAKACE